MPAKSTPRSTTSRSTTRTTPRPTKQQCSAAEKQRRAVEMRTTGATFDQIASELHYRDKSGARRAYLAGLSHLPELDDRDTMLRVESARLDALQHAVWSQAMQGDKDAVQNALAVMARRARMLGLDAPTKSEHKVTTELDAEIEAMVREMAALSEQRDRQPG